MINVLGTNEPMQYRQRKIEMKHIFLDFGENKLKEKKIN